MLLLKAGLPIRACAIEGNGGFDTHTNQIAGFGDDLQSNCDALKAYQDHLEAEGIADRVVTFVWSEFGRRPEENDSNGTDHGAAGVGFLIGSKATGQTIGEFPTLDSTGPRRLRQRARDVRLPRRLLLGDRGLAEHRRRDGHPGRRPAAALPGRPDELSARCPAARVPSLLAAAAALAASAPLHRRAGAAPAPALRGRRQAPREPARHARARVHRTRRACASAPGAAAARATCPTG